MSETLLGYPVKVTDYGKDLPHEIVLGRPVMSDTARRVMRMRASAALLVEMCKNTSPRTFRVTKNALPEDARLVGMTVDVARNMVWLFVESAAFDPVPELMEVPIMDDPQFESIQA